MRMDLIYRKINARGQMDQDWRKRGRRNMDKDPPPGWRNLVEDMGEISDDETGSDSYYSDRDYLHFETVSTSFVDNDQVNMRKMREGVKQRNRYPGNTRNRKYSLPRIVETHAEYEETPKDTTRRTV